MVVLQQVLGSMPVTAPPLAPTSDGANAAAAAVSTMQCDNGAEELVAAEPVQAPLQPAKQALYCLVMEQVRICLLAAPASAACRLQG